MYQRTVNGKPDYRIQLEDGYLPQGPDGQGRNRLAIHMMGPLVRCVLQPTTRQAALDTLRGMAYSGADPTSYAHCNGGDCASCPVACSPRAGWDDAFRVREDASGLVLEGADRQVFASWRALLAAVDAPALRRSMDEKGFFWMAA